MFSCGSHYVSEFKKWHYYCQNQILLKLQYLINQSNQWKERNKQTKKLEQRMKQTNKEKTSLIKIFWKYPGRYFLSKKTRINKIIMSC